MDRDKSLGLRRLHQHQTLRRMNWKCSRCDVPSRGQSAGLQRLICLDGSNRAETCVLLARRPNSFDDVSGLNIKGCPGVLVGLNVLGGYYIICSANVLGGFGALDNLDLRNDFDVLDGREVLEVLDNGLEVLNGLKVLDDGLKVLDGFEALTSFS